MKKNCFSLCLLLALTLAGCGAAPEEPVLDPTVTVETAAAQLGKLGAEGRYVGTVSEGDFLWKVLSCERPALKDLEHIYIREILRTDNYPAVPITVSVEALLNSAMNQNFIPVVDDYNSFIGIVTRREIISRLSNQKPETLRRIV